MHRILLGQTTIKLCDEIIDKLALNRYIISSKGLPIHGPNTNLCALEILEQTLPSAKGSRIIDNFPPSVELSYLGEPYVYSF